MDNNNSTELINRANSWLDKTFSPKGKQLFLVIVMIACIGLIILTIFFMQNNVTKNNADIINEQQFNDKHSKNLEENEEIDKTIEEIEIITQDTYVNLSVEETGRANPFLPYSEAVSSGQSTPRLNPRIGGHTLLPPPEALTSDSEASHVIKTKVSGILYDSMKPSAILNIEGSDYLVRIGDFINGYKVLGITKDLVTVQLGKNIYKAHVGEIINDSPITQNYVYDLEHRFGGAKK